MKMGSVVIMAVLVLGLLVSGASALSFAISFAHGDSAGIGDDSFAKAFAAHDSFAKDSYFGDRASTEGFAAAFARGDEAACAEATTAGLSVAGIPVA